MKDIRHIIIIGAGPSGLTAGYELLSRGGGSFDVTIIEKTDRFGGISCTVCHEGNRMDLGGHRFFSKSTRVTKWWTDMLPGILKRERLSHIYFNGNYYPYPLTFDLGMIFKMGPLCFLKAGFSYLSCAAFPREEKTLEDLYINRFGKKLYSMFFEKYTENLWGVHPSKISPEWGYQRVKGLNIAVLIKDIFRKSKETSLIDSFLYPPCGPGELWETVAGKIKKMGGRFIMDSSVCDVKFSDEGNSVSYAKDGTITKLPCDIVISSMPIKDLIASMHDVPLNISKIADALPYRDFMTVGLLLPKDMLRHDLKDNWIYVHDKDVKLGRIQVFNNWSPYMVEDPYHNVWIGLEYFCSEGDVLWSLEDDGFARLAIDELKLIGLLRQEAHAITYHVERVPKAYPSYFGTYSDFDTVKKYLCGFERLYLIGRNGQHRYNNMDHSMLCAFAAADNILTGAPDKTDIWNINSEKEYLEKSDTN